MAKNIKAFFILLVLLGIIFTRFFNLEKTTRFTRDESSNLYDMHRIYVDKKLTLIGPIDSTKTIIYPSLTFYMLLPFAIIGNFEPASPAYGTAFFGVIMALFLLVLVKKINKSYFLLFSLLLIVWFPFLEAARWAWNPHLVPFWQTIAILFFLKKGKWYKFASGIFFGLSFHLHYLVIISFMAFLVCVAIVSLRKKTWKDPLFLFLGFLLMLAPFVVFDLRHPPGLFFGRFLRSNMVSVGFEQKLALFLKTFPINVGHTLFYLSGQKYLSWLLGISLLILAVSDLIKRRANLIFLVAALSQIAIISFLPTFENRYFFLGIVFFIVWLIEKRGRWQEKVAKFAMLVMLVGSLLLVKNVLTKPIREPDTYSITKVSNFIADEVKKKDIKNINIAALASPDQDPLGAIYRHVLEIKGVKPLLVNQYDITDNLFVVTTSDEDKVRKDQANIMTGFRKGPIVDRYQVDTTLWRVYLFNREDR